MVSYRQVQVRGLVDVIDDWFKRKPAPSLSPNFQTFQTAFDLKDCIASSRDDAFFDDTDDDDCLITALVDGDFFKII